MRISVHPNIKGAVIDKNIYGHFSEHLGRCIYGGLFVGEDSPIPNEDGIRLDVLRALQHIRVPNLRWPGGCFADEYHWRDGIGQKDTRKRMVNNNWGGVVEDNSFGTHEFMDLCEKLGCEPYINMNVGSGSVQEMQEWVEYLTMDGVSPMSDLRKKNGREEAWKLRLLGVGNENWGCGGNMRAAYYADVYKRYATFCRNYGDNKLYKIACGAGTSIQEPNYAWTQTLMEQAGRDMDALSLHYYTVAGPSWQKKGSATDFDENEYYVTLSRAAFMEELLCGHEAVMDRYDREGRVALIVDEWGTWFDVEPGTNPGFLYQQNTMRDAMVAAITLNIFNHHARRVKCTNIAQIVNVLQSVILTDGERMLLTPTYHVFDLFKVHQDATSIHLAIENELIGSGETVNRFSASASVDAAGKVNLTLANISVSEPAPARLRLDGAAYKFDSGEVLSGKMDAKNTFEDTNCVQLHSFDDVSVNADTYGSEVAFTMPPCSVMRLTFGQ